MWRFTTIGLIAFTLSIGSGCSSSSGENTGGGSAGTGGGSASTGGGSAGEGGGSAGEGGGSGTGGGSTTMTVTPTTTDVGSTGGEIHAGDVSVTIPAGALSATTTIVIGPAPSGLHALPLDVPAAGPAVAITPHGTQLAGAPAIITLPHDGSADVVLTLADESADTWEVVPGAVIGEHSITVAVQHFSFFVAVSNCAGVCQAAFDTVHCGANRNACQAACMHDRDVINHPACLGPSNALASCYIGKKGVAGAFDCSRGYDWPLAATCATEAAAVDTCVNGPTLPSSCKAGLLGYWHLPQDSALFGGEGPDMYFGVLADRVVVCADDDKSAGGYVLSSCEADGVARGAMCGWDTGTTADLTLDASGTSVTLTVTQPNSGASASAGLVRALEGELPTWCTTQLVELKGTPIDDIPDCSQ